MIKEINNRAIYIENAHRKIMTSIAKIQKNAKKGIGSESIMEFEGYDKGNPLDSSSSKGYKIYAGRLEEMAKKNKTGGDKKGAKKDKEEANKLGAYFKDMDSKQNLTVTQGKLQKKLDENRGRRNIMKA